MLIQTTTDAQIEARIIEDGRKSRQTCMPIDIYLARRYGEILVDLEDRGLIRRTVSAATREQIVAGLPSVMIGIAPVE